MKNIRFFIALLFSLNVTAIQAQWTEIPGVQTATIISMAKQNGVFFSSAPDVAFRSFDGHIWQIIQGLPPLNDNKVELKIELSRLYIYVSHLDVAVGLYYSTDQGASLTSIILPPNIMSVFYSGTRIFGVDGANRFYKTDNDGASWEQVFSQSFANPMMDIVHYNSELRLVSGSNIFASIDNGLNWTTLSNGFFGTQSKLFFIGSKLYCYSETDAPQVSDNGGLTWNAIPDLAEWKGAFSSDMVEFGGKLYATNYKDLFSSSDNGLSWQGSGLYGGGSLIIDGADLLSGGESGVLRSSDIVSWKTSFKCSAWGSYDEVREIQTFDGATFVTTNRSRTFFTKNNGLDWQIISFTPLAQRMLPAVSTIFIQPVKLSAGSNVPVPLQMPNNNGDFKFAYGNNTLMAYDQVGLKIWKSIDEGSNWIQIVPPFSEYCWDLAFAGGRFFISFPNKVYYSDDDGQSWTLFTQGTSNLQNSNFHVAGNDIFLYAFLKTYRFYPTGWQLWGEDNMNFTGENGRFFGWVTFPKQLKVYDDNGQVLTDIPQSNHSWYIDLGALYKNNLLYTVGKSTAAPYAWSIWTLDFSNTLNSLVSGKVFLDESANGIQDAGERNLAENLVSLSPNGFATTTDALGNYNFMLWQNGDVMKPALPSAWYQSSPPEITLNQTGSNYNFAIQPKSTAVDLSIDATAYSVFRPGFQSNIKLTVTNLGTVAQGGMVTVDLPGFMAYENATPAPTSINGTSLEWQLSTIPLLEHTTITLTVLTDASATLGVPADIEATVIANNLDADLSNNIDRIDDRLVGAYDPNDKTVVPENFSPQQLLDGQELSYKVRFQNTGTWPATYVKILDTLSNTLDVTSFRFISSSHPVTYRILQGHILEFFFRDINLADSLSDEPGSHGFVHFSLRPKSSLALGTVIPNRVGIYFDFNEPVITNIAKSTVKLSSLTKELFQSISIAAAPNPASDRLILSWSAQVPDDSRMLLTSATGQAIGQFRIPPGATQLEVSVRDLPAGVYFCRLEHKGKSLGFVKVTRQ